MSALIVNLCILVPTASRALIYFTADLLDRYVPVLSPLLVRVVNRI
jgi:hypothetical protein